MWNRFYVNRKPILKKSGLWTANVFAMLGFVALFAPLDDLLTKVGVTVFWYQVLASMLVLSAVFCLCFIFVTLYVLGQKKVKVLEGRNGKAVYVMYGDLFDDKIIPTDKARKNICFAVNRCFDTVVDNRLISADTIHGKMFKQLYDSDLYSPDTLNVAIQASIIHGASYKTLTKEQKAAGNLKRYEVGTGADLAVSDSLHYFLIGLGKMDVNLRNSAENGEYCQAIQKMIEFFDAFSQGYPVLMPIVGAGLTRLGQDPKDLLKYLVQSFSINMRRLSSDVYIVVREEDRKKISIVDLKQC